MPRPAWLIRSTRTRTVTVYSIAVQADGKILAGGDFTERTASADRRATTSPGSMPPPAWLIRSTRTRTVSVHSIAVQADGKILAGGDFITLAPNGGATVTRNHIARLETDGRLDQTLNLSTRRQRMFSPPPFSRTARFLSAAALPRFGRGAQQHCTIEHGRHARHGFQPERER